MTVALFETLFGFFSPLYPIRYLLSQHEAPRAHTPPQWQTPS
jgi:hypothetical protein